MKAIVCGGRDYIFSAEDQRSLEALFAAEDITEIITGGASGADQSAENLAKKNGIQVRCFTADWNTHGRSAGPIRNEQMAKYADACIIFPGGKGTADMERRARKAGLIIFDMRVHQAALSVSSS